ncbi:hypothetical protein [Nonomuraea sp. NPDC049480]|uniref:hypothetical protein n=1 Tax=Nonomuraea sp. NPDC049480 TaxID=3364353 RepID=UPI0037B906CE
MSSTVTTRGTARPCALPRRPHGRRRHRVHRSPAPPLPRSAFTAAGIDVPPGEGLHPVTVGKVTLGSAGQAPSGPGLAGAFPGWFESGFGFRIGGLPTHEFFKPYAPTFGFARMRIPWADVTAL